MTRKIRFMETILRDGQQSQIATRMPIEDMLPVLGDLDAAGFYALECWGGATFDACLRYLNEDPWERLRTIREHVKNTKLQMLLRGQNLLGYHNYPDDVVAAFVKKSVENGIDVLRIFDALNDTRNLKTSIRAAKEAGGEVQAAISYTTSDVHTVRYFTQLAIEMERAGADSICIKDMAGVLTPDVATELVTEIKGSVDIPLQIHTHGTAGIAQMTLLKAVEAGADIIDTCLSPFAEGTSQPATESMAIALEALGYELLVLHGYSAHFKIFLHRHLRPDAASLGALRKPGGDDLFRVHIVQFEAVEFDRPFRRLQHAGKAHHESAFPCAVGADQRNDGTLFRLHRHIVQGLNMPVSGAKILNFKKHARIVGHRRRRAFGKLLAVAEHREPVGDRYDEIHVVFYQEDRDSAFVSYLQNNIYQFFGFERVKAGGGFVEEQQLRRRCERERDGEHPLLSVGYVLYQIFSPVVKAAELQNIFGVLKHILIFTSGSLPVYKDVQYIRLPVLVETYLDALFDGNVGEYVRLLEGAHKAHAGYRVGFLSGNIAAQERHAAGRRLQKSADQIEERRLSGPVRADQRHDLPLVDGEIDVLNSLQTAEMYGQSPSFK